jgi:hypothetical protein
MKKICAVLLAATSVAACTEGLKSGGDDTTGPTGPGSGSAVGPGSGSADQYQQILDSRVVDYGAALRIAAVKLTGTLPTVAETTSITSLTDPTAQQTAYNALITDYLSRPTFASQMLDFWRDTFKQGGTPLLDTAPTLAAQLSATNGSYMNLFTQSSGNCPTYNATTNTFTPAECGNGGPVSGVLTDPGVMTQFFSNFGFRRVRWIQEIFVCTAFPAEITNMPINVGGAAPYTSPWPFKSVATTENGGAGRIDFQDTSAIICANCHTTINHIAPLFAMYDGNGKYQSVISVPTPLVGAPLAVITDYLAAGETTAWRYGVEAPDIPTIGTDMAADPSVAECGVARIWNWALDKDDIVDALEVVPPDTISTEVASFTSGGFKMRDMIYTVFTSQDFVSF